MIKRIKVNGNYNLPLKLILFHKDHKVHQVIEFDQEAWLKEYINFNAEL